VLAEIGLRIIYFNYAGSNPSPRRIRRVGLALRMARFFRAFFILMNTILKSLKESKANAYTYILVSHKDHGIYIGSTRNLIDRYFKKHLKGQVRSTKYRLPLELIYFEEYDSYSLAYKREKYLKTGAGRDWLKNNIL